MGLLSRLFEARPDPREKVRPLWNAIVAEARSADWYREGGVEDSVSGRFDMVALVTAVVLLRMESSRELAAPSTHVTELFVEDMDGQLREFGVGDMVVGKHVGRLVSTLGGRLGALREALPHGEDAVRDVVRRNVTLRDGADPGFVAHRLVALSQSLAENHDEALLGGKLRAGEAA